MKRLIIGLMVGLCLMMETVISTQEYNKTAEQQKTRPELQARIEKLISQLSADKPEIRDQAQMELIDIGRPALDVLEKHPADKDPDLALRIGIIRKEISARLVISDFLRKQPVLWYKVLMGEKTNIGYLRLKTRTDTRQGKPVFIFEDLMVSRRDEEEQKIAVTTVCADDKYLSTLSILVEVEMTGQKKTEYQIDIKDNKATISKKGDETKPKEVEINPQQINFYAFLRLLTACPFEKYSQLQSRVFDYTIRELRPFCTGQILEASTEKLVYGEKEIATHKVVLEGGPSTAWIDNDHRLLQFQLDDDEIKRPRMVLTDESDAKGKTK